MRLRSNRGAALPTVIMVMLVTFIFASIVLTMTTSETKAEITYETNMKALHAAETGINQYLWYINKENADPIPMETEIGYPEHNPEFIYTLKLIEDTSSKKVIQSTGWTIGNPDLKRKVEVTLTKRSFTQYVYFSDNDPIDIYWSSRDRCYGPYHTNTSLYISGNPIFFDKVTYVDKIEKKNGNNDHPVFKKGHEQVSEITFPTSNSELKARAEEGGYLYTGRTCIRLNEDGTVTIRNKEKSTETKPLPSNGVIYVDGSTKSVGDKFNLDAGNVFIGGTLNGRLTVAAANDIYITDYDPTVLTLRTNTMVTNGVKYKNVTFSKDTDNGNISYSPTNATDMLGLIANRHVGILTNGWFKTDSWSPAPASGDITVCAAVFAIGGKFGNSAQLANSNNTSYPSTPGTLTLWGSIIQSERGAVGKFSGDTTTEGYSKDYAHDPRLLYDQPPYFLEPMNSGWEINEWNEK